MPNCTVCFCFLDEYLFMLSPRNDAIVTVDIYINMPQYCLVINSNFNTAEHYLQRAKDDRHDGIILQLDIRCSHLLKTSLAVLMSPPYLSRFGYL